MNAYEADKGNGKKYMKIGLDIWKLTSAMRKNEWAVNSEFSWVLYVFFF